MAILGTCFCQIFGVVGTILQNIAGERFTTCINNCLDCNDNMQTLKRNLQELTSIASDIEEKVNNEELLGKKRRTTEVQDWLEKVGDFKKEYDKLQEAGFCRRLLHGNHVKNLIELVGENIQKRQTFQELVVACETSRVRLSTKKLHVETLKQDSDKILVWLEAESDKVTRIGIYGMGGVGKTTLVEHIETYLRANSVHVYWLTVSQEVDINKLQIDLAKQLNVVLPKDDNEEEKAGILNRALIKRKNVVLVLDNVWKVFDLSNIGISLEASGCKVIITSRSLDVCNKMGCKTYIVKVQPLSEEEAWKFFFETLDCAYELSPGAAEVAKTMSKKCTGVPLVIISLAKSMIGVYDIREWRNALEGLKQSITRFQYMDNEVLRILLYSYNRLTDQSLQQCFLDCSLYPEDYEIPKDELISQFIFEGMMDQRGSRVAEFDQGHTILNRLVKVCLLESVEYMGERCVKMHDLLREMAVEITRKNPRFMIRAGLQLDELPDEKDWTEDLDKVSLMRNNISKIPERSSPKCPRLSTLILSYNPLKFIPDSFFAQMRSLRVLNLSSTKIEKLPNSISELENLTALLLGFCSNLWYVPSLEKLTALTELDICGAQIEEVPKGMECLVELKCLNMKHAYILTEIPAGLLPRLSRLQRLILPDHIKVKTEELESLKLLEEFVGWADDMCNSNWFNKSPPLSFYNIKGGDEKYGAYNYIHERQIICKECTFKGDVLLMPQNIQCLEIQECKGLSDCLLEVDPSPYKDFKYCTIGECDGIQSILRIFSSSKDEGALQKLEYLTLSELPDFIGLIKLEQPRAIAVPPRGTFSSLKQLIIYDCHRIKKLVSHKLLVQNLRNLEMIRVSGCNQMEEIIADDEEDEGVSSTSTSSSSNSRSNNKNSPTSSSSVSSADPSSIAFPKLEEIRLESLPLLKSIYKGNIICCDSIRNIEITDCPKLKRLPFFHPSADERPPPPSASSSSSSSSYCNNYGTATCNFPKLTELTLSKLPELTSICDGIMICDSIYRIIVTGCTQLTRLPLFLSLMDGQPSPPPSLRRIELNETEREWWESLKLDHPNSHNVLEPFLRYNEDDGLMFL